VEQDIFNSLAMSLMVTCPFFMLRMLYYSFVELLNYAYKSGIDGDSHNFFSNNFIL
jgi:hypothetical protein